MQIVILPVATLAMCIIGFLLLKRDVSEHSLTKDEVNIENHLSKKQYLYCGIMSLITICAAFIFATIYKENTICFSIKRLALLSIMWPIGLIDYKTYRIPNAFIVLGLLYRVVIFPFELLFFSQGVWYTLLSEVIAAAALLLSAGLCALCIKNAIGFGDMKLFVVMGLLLSLDGIWGAIFLSLIVSFLISGYLLITKKITRKDAIPFGPALVIGTFLSVCISGM